MFIKKRKDFIIKGQVIEQGCCVGVEGLRIEVWSKDCIFDDLEGNVLTGPQGIFQMTFKASNFSEIFFDRQPDLYFKVYRDNLLIQNTRDTILWNASKNTYNITIEVESECTSPSCDEDYSVSGKVYDASGTPLSMWYTVRAFHRHDDLNETEQGKATSDQQGIYRILFSKSTYKESGTQCNGLNLFVRAYDQSDHKIGESRQIDNAPRDTKELDIEIYSTPYRIHGTIRDENNKPIQKYFTIKAFDRDLRTHQFLGGTIAKDNYEITYDRQKFSRAEKDTADIEIWLLDDEGKLLLKVVPDETAFNAPADIEINLVVPVAESLTEWERMQTVVPLLEGQGLNGKSLPVWDLNDADIDFIVRERQIDREQLRLWIMAARNAHEIALLPPTGITADQLTHHLSGDTSLTDNIEWIVFYGWYRDGQPQEFSELLRRGSDTLLISLDHAIEQHYIPAISAELKLQIKVAVDARQISDAIKPAPEGQSASFGDVFRTMPQSGLLQLDKPQGLGAQIVSVLVKETVNLEEQWQKIHELVGNNALFNSVRRSVSLMQLTEGYKPMIAALQLGEVSDTAAMLADLVKHDSQQWIDLATQWGAPSSITAESDEERTTIYGRQLAQKIELMHPAPYVQYRVLTNQIPVVDERKEWLLTFLNANPGMRIKDGSVLVWLNSDKVQYGDLSEAQIKQITPDVLRFERVGKLVRSLEHLGPILKLGYESARDIVLNRAREVFVDEIKDVITNKIEAAQIYDTASGVVATTEALVLMYSPHFGGANLPVMASVRYLTGTESLIQSANLQLLFGSQDYCECAHGASLYGPAAYLADLLQMLARAKLHDDTDKTALDILLERRPDLAEIDLTADNTDITLPYIDLVLEILEAPGSLTIARFPSGVGPVDGFDGILTSGKVPEAMKHGDGGPTDESFAKFGIILGEDQDLSVHGPASGPWRIRDKSSGVKYRLEKSSVQRYYDLKIFPESVAGAAKGYRPWTSSTSAMLLNVGSATFPWKLPFDVVRDEANTWLLHLGATRAELMQAFLGDSGWSAIDTACEYLNISPSERHILNAGPSNEYKDWGFVDSPDSVFDPIAGINRAGIWHELLQYVSLLRSRARLTHRELLNVLETWFVRDGGARLEITGKECDTGDMRLMAMNAALARRIHLFVRLWRKLGWSTRDLDRAITAYGVGTIAGGFVVFTNQFLLFLANIARLHALSRLPVPELLDLFGATPNNKPRLDTTEYWDHSGALPQRTLSRYQQWFDNPTLGKPKQPEFRFDDSTSSKLADIAIPKTGLPKVRISDHATYIAAALAIPESELAMLLPLGATCIRPSNIEATLTGSSIEVSGAALKEIEIVVGKISIGATFSLLIESSNDNQTFIPVPEADLPAVTQNPIQINSSGPMLRRYSYGGAGKFLRCTITPSALPSSLWISVRILTTPGVVIDELSLANLTIICRYAILRRLFRLSINELQILMVLSNVSSLTAIDGPDKVLTLLDAHHALNTLGLSISQADQLLRGSDESAALDLTDRVEALLTTVRAEAQAIRDESTVSDDKRSSLLKTVLTGLGWDERLIANVLGGEGLGSNFGDYEAPLDVMPAGVLLPPSVTFNATTGLTAAGTVLPAALQHDLEPLIAQVTGNLLIALQHLEKEAARRIEVLAWMRAKRLPTHRVDLKTVPTLKSELPAEWKGRIYYDLTDHKLCLVGWMMEADKNTLKSFEVSPPPNSPFAAAIDTLYQASSDYHVNNINDQLVVPEGPAPSITYNSLLIETEGLEARSGLILERLLSEWRQQRLHVKLSSALSQDLGIPLDATETLIELPHSAAISIPSFELLITDAQLLASDPATKLSRVAFVEAFDAATRVLLLGKLASLQKMDATQVPWLGGIWISINLTNLPTQRVLTVPPGAWESLAALSSLIALRDKAAVGVVALQKILGATTRASSTIAYTQLTEALGYSEDTLRVFASADGFNISSSEWFRDPVKLLRLIKCLELARQMNMPASLFVALKQAQLVSRSPLDAESEVQVLRRMALGNSTASNWTDAERKVLDGIRQRRRDATVDYLVQQTPGAIDANDLYGYYLIDPQMNSCMLTSRIKQAISSVQLFIQRCLMNLERVVPPHVINKQNWDWMKNYRVWEANRKVLLYPENWIEPELRDDKTPFFDDVVSSLQQGDATSDKAEKSLQTFLEKLSDLSRMDIVATCSDYDEIGRVRGTHLFARTLAEPYTYWHRQFRTQDVTNPSSTLGIWTAWQPIDLDIEGDHLCPFVWQGRLFLFWAIFSEMAKQQTDDQLKAGDARNPTKFWSMKLAWSEMKSGKWSSRRLTQRSHLAVRFDIQVTSEWPFYFTALPSKDGVTISIYWTFNFSLATPPLTELRPLVDPVTILYFDGNNIQTYAAFFNYLETVNISKLVERIGYSIEGTELPIHPLDTPPLNSPPLVRPHQKMKIDVNRSQPLTLLSNKGTNITTQTSLSRSTQLLYSTNQGKAVFSAPSALPVFSFEGIISPNDRTTPFVQSDWIHRFFVYPSWHLAIRPNFGLYDFPHLHFYSLDWLQATRLRKTLTESGLEKLLSYDSQVEKQSDILGYFSREYPLSSEVSGESPDGDLEFSAHSATAQYNWELFFHLPLTVACNLSKNQRFEEAQRWFHYIFDPTDNSPDPSPKRYWRFRSFREAGQGLRIDELVQLLADPGPLDSLQQRAKSDFKTLITMWKDKPFQPHLVARMRIRSYMYTVVMKYLDNLIAWGDQLFRRDTLEALNEATQLYILAAQILGRRPEGIPRRTRPIVKSFSELADPDDLSNAWVEAENLVPGTSSSGTTQTQNNPKSLYFCVPNNPKLLEYYDRVEDRLFKLRNCMNIDGVVRQLPLFEPAIDPSILVRAAAAGVDVGAVLADLNAPLPFYRFNVMAPKAMELCSEVKSLGAALLSAIEKGDTESLALMRSGQEIQMLQSVRMVKELQLYEAKASMDAIGMSLESAQKRFTHYIGLVSQMESLSIPTGPVGPTIQSLALAAIEPLTKIATFVQSTTTMVDPITVASVEMIKQSLARTAEALSATLPPESTATDKVPMNAAEKRQLSELKSAHDLQQKAMDQRLVAQMLAKIPDFTVGASGVASPVATFQIGGTLFSSFANFSASLLDSEASEHTYRASLHSTLAGYQRRAADWLLQAELAAKDIEQITKQIAASNLRLAIASQELRNHDLQIENAQAVEEFMHSKYSNRELYNWMSGQLSNLYFQAYQLAYDVAKRAERCFKHELGVDNSFIKFGYWDNLKKGLLAGENLFSDLKRMEVAYLNQNARELEITKHVSLRQLDGEALMRLRAGGECEFVTPEALFDLDFPGHYFRRIKSVSVTVPCVVGPYTGVSGTLTLLSSSIRDKPAIDSGAESDPNIRSSYLQIQSIATSTGQNDSGLFELNFRDERYLPFEGAGAISRWRFKLPSDYRAFDYDTISDLIVHIRYTARDGGGTLADSAISELNDRLGDATQSNLWELISLRHDFPTEWNRFKQQPEGGLKIKLTDEHFPYLYRSRIQLGSPAKLIWNDNGELKEGANVPMASREFTIANIVADDPYLIVPYTILSSSNN